MSLLFQDLTVTVQLVHMCCGECGIHFAVDQNKYKRCKDIGEGWFCPNGHNRVFSKPHNKELEDRIKKLETSNQHLRTARENLHSELTIQKHKTAAEKAAKTRLKNRVKHGVCPCCNRTFRQLAEHMKTKHPDYVNL